MQVLKTIRPGQSGARRFERRFGERLCAVRYRQPLCGRKILTTVELIADERPTPPPGISYAAVHASRKAELVALQISYEETELRHRIKQAGGRWSRAAKAWITRRDTAVTLGVAHRIVQGLVDKCTDIDVSIQL